MEANLRRTLLDLALITLRRSGDGKVVYLANSCVSPNALWETAAAPGLRPSFQGDGGARVYILEPFGRKCPRGFPSAHFRRLAGYDDKRISLVCGGEDNGEDRVVLPAGGLVVCDLSDIHFYLDQPKLQMLLPKLVDLAKTAGVSVAGIVDPILVTPECRAWIEGAADGIVRLWDEDEGRFAGVVKSPSRKRFEPKLLVERDEPPFFDLI